ncbi:hypothetical protein EZV62_015167 [Acer yangbiense]|uniref:Pentacotripeptide-repeat region of PRORP domain-containing protein n=1 Tax=Acer yangbiense TaxID=1000413 RepID=A0A5C7HUY0_9ROSI|nr:hypothetical protein EZV62_015167 [Acer yangbiense]
MASLYNTALKCKHFSQKPTYSNSNTTMPPNSESFDRFLKEKCRAGNVSPDEARFFFDCLIQKKPTPHMSSFTILFTSLAKNNHYDTVISLTMKFNSTGILRLGFCSDDVLFTSLIKGNDEIGVICKPNIVCYTSMIDSLCKDGFIEKANELFSEMMGSGISPNVVTYTSLIHGLCCGGKWDEAKDLIVEMVDQHVTPNVVTFNVIIDEFCKNGKIDKANELLELMMKRSVSPTTVTYNTLIYGFCLMGRIDDVMGCRHVVFSYNIMINGYCKNHKLEEAMSLYRDMISEGIMSDATTYGEEKYSGRFFNSFYCHILACKG